MAAFYATRERNPTFRNLPASVVRRTGCERPLPTHSRHRPIFCRLSRKGIYLDVLSKGWPSTTLVKRYVGRRDQTVVMRMAFEQAT
jgi:hypothetical protein